MLQTLSIKNVALIKELNIEFGKGLNILLGETGAGKSIIFDALNFVLGDKSDRTLIRYGEKEMRVDAVFSNLSEMTMTQLSNLGFEGEDIALSRSLSIEGKSTIRINGIPTVQNVLREVGKVLVDSYSQHESIDLLKTKNHLAMLDKFGGREIEVIKEEVRNKFEIVKEINSKIEALGGDEFDRERRKSLLEYQIKEIEDADLTIGEDAEIEEKLKIIENSEKIKIAISECENNLIEGPSPCVNQIYNSITALSNLNGFSNINELNERLNSVMIEIEDICDSLKDIYNSTDFDEREFEILDKRRDLIKSLKKKYGGSIENIKIYFNKINEEYENLENSESLLLKLRDSQKNAAIALESECEKLSIKRKEIFETIKDRLLIELGQLGMKSSKFEVNFTRLENITSNGFDDIEFLFSANKGQEVKSLSKTASGGELNRFMLALKNLFAETEGAETLIFDEIDAGISGETGKMVGLKLSNITKHFQIICITHLPQVACYGDDFYVVSKKEIESETVTEINHLKESEIDENISKLIVGNDITQMAVNQINEMRLKLKNKK